MKTENKPTTTVGAIQNLFTGSASRPTAPTITVTSSKPLTLDEAARIAEALETEGFPWVIEGADVDPIFVTDNVERRSRAVPRVKRGG
jgi:hypothetical protein